MVENILQTKALTKEFGGLVAVNNFDLALRHGEIVGLIGPNGSGKTTLINLLSGVYVPTRGEILFDGVGIAGLPPDQISSKGLLRTFQVPKLFGNMTVMENMLLPDYARSYRLTGSSTRAQGKAEGLLGLAGLLNLRDAPAKHLSGGQQALLQLVRGFMVDGLSVYLLDEPFAGVNPVTKDTIAESVVRNCREKGTAFLVVSHEMAQIRQLCDRVCVMAEGALVAQGSLEEVAADERVIEAYLGRTGA